MVYKIKYIFKKCNQLAKVSRFQHNKSQDSKKIFQHKHCKQIIHFDIEKQMECGQNQFLFFSTPF